MLLTQFILNFLQKALDSKTYVIRSFQLYRCEESEFYVLADDVIDLVILALQAQGVPEEEYDCECLLQPFNIQISSFSAHVETLRFMNSSFEEEHFNVMKFHNFEEAVEKFDIDKGSITVCLSLSCLSRVLNFIHFNFFRSFPI